jgi:hypothetical protein
MYCCEVILNTGLISEPTFSDLTAGDFKLVERNWIVAGGKINPSRAHCTTLCTRSGHVQERSLQVIYCIIELL